MCCRQHVTWHEFHCFLRSVQIQKFFCTKFQTDVSCSPISNNSDGSFKTLIKILCLISSCFWRSDSSIGLCKWGLSEFWLVWIVGYLYKARYSIKKILILAHSQLERFISYLNHMRCMKWFSADGSLRCFLSSQVTFFSTSFALCCRRFLQRKRKRPWQPKLLLGNSVRLWPTHFYEGN